MVQRNTQDIMGKKSKASSSEEKEMAPLYTNTTCNRDVGIATWESMYNLLEEENPRVMEVTATTGSHSSSEATITELACSFLHRIAARPKILPYMDMVKWILDSVDVINRQFKTQGQELTESLFSQNVNFISAKIKKCKRRKTHQGSSNQETKAFSNVRFTNRASLRKRKASNCSVTCKPQKLQESNDRDRLEIEGSRKGRSNPRVNQVELGLLLGILGKAT